MEETVAVNEREKPARSWAPNVKYGLAYEEEEAVFQLTNPNAMVSGLNKTSGDNGARLLVDYKNMDVKKEIDKDGNLSIYTKYLDGGDGSMHMPPDVYNELKGKMPAKDEDPLISTIIKDGTAFGIKKSGESVTMFTYDPDAFKIDTTNVDSALSISHVEGRQTEQRVQENLNRIKGKQGVNRLDENHILIESGFSQGCCEETQPVGEEISGIKKVIDLRIGQVVREGVLDQQGRLSSVSFIHYKNVDGYMVEDIRNTYVMADEDGRYYTKYLYSSKRKNIEVIRSGF
jgi:hypothetical protein